MERTKLYNDFKCRCDGGQYCETMEEEIPNDHRVIIDRCGCIFRKSHLEAFIRNQLGANVLKWFTGGGEVTHFTCPSRDGIVGGTYRACDVIVDRSDRYMEIWRLANQSPRADFSALTENRDFNTRQFALISPALAEVLVAISQEQRESKWEGMTWSAFISSLRDLETNYRHQQLDPRGVQRKIRYDELKNATLQRWEERKNQCLGRHRQPAFDERSWGIFKKMVFTARFIYNGAIAIISYYGLWVLRLGNFVSEDTYTSAIEENVGQRMAILLLERNGIEYNLREASERNPHGKPLKTFEYRLWNHLNGH